MIWRLKERFARLVCRIKGHDLPDHFEQWGVSLCERCRWTIFRPTEKSDR